MDKVLGLTGIAAFITLLGVIFQHILASKNKNITEERCKWRERLKDLAIVIENGKELEVRKAITELKTRINSFGFDGGTILEDSHIWKIIKDNKISKDEKHKLGLYISLLLKYDWERCKHEVNHWCVRPYEMLGVVCFLGIIGHMVLTQDYSLSLQGVLITIVFFIFVAEMYFKTKKDNLDFKYVEHVNRVSHPQKRKIKMAKEWLYKPKKKF